jgi:hypothetical protein
MAFGPGYAPVMLRKRPGFQWERREECQCESCLWKGNCRGEDWPYWREVKEETADVQTA